MQLPASQAGAAVRDLMGLLALPALWAGRDGETVMSLMVDAVCSITPIAAVYSRVRLLPQDEPCALLKTGPQPISRHIPPQWLEFVRTCDGIYFHAERSAVLESPVGTLKMERFQIGAGSQEARIWFGSREAGFPSTSQTAFMRAAVSLAATGLNSARIEYERAQANRAKDEFLAMLGHELRNPLAPIVTALGLIRIKGSGHLEKEHAVIARQVGYLSRLVDDLLDITRITRDSVQLRREVFGLHRSVIEAVEGVSPLLEERQHKITVDVDERFCIDGDPERIRQVFANLLINAAKYTANGGHIAVTASVNSGMAVVNIRDNGCGINSALLPRVFDLFEQGATTIDRARGGLGIGLAIVKKLVTLHGGKVSAYSAGLGQGSTFSVQLPVLNADAGLRISGPAPSTVAGIPTGRRVMLVDDNVDALESLETLLTLSGFEVLTASNPTEALQKAAAFAPHAFVLDIGLPGLDGYQLAAELRRTGGQQAASAHFIALTGYGQSSDKMRTAAAGFHCHFVKPVELDDLIAALKQG